MPYIGVEVKLISGDITVKLHGPMNNISVSTQELKQSISVYWMNAIVNNIPEKVDVLAEKIRDDYCDGKDILWVLVEFKLSSNNTIYGSTAEKILLDV